MCNCTGKWPFFAATIGYFGFGDKEWQFSGSFAHFQDFDRSAPDREFDAASDQGIQILTPVEFHPFRRADIFDLGHHFDGVSHHCLGHPAGVIAMRRMAPHPAPLRHFNQRLFNPMILTIG